MGEGLVKRLRKTVPRGLRGESWQAPILTKFYRTEAMDFVNFLFGPKINKMEDGIGSNLDIDESQESMMIGAMDHAQQVLWSLMFHTRRFRRYQDSDHFHKCHDEKRCLSLVVYIDIQTTETCLGFISATQAEWYVTFLELAKDHRVNEGLLYLYFLAHRTSPIKIKSKTNMNLDEYEFQGFCIAVPHDEHHMYALLMGDGSRFNQRSFFSVECCLGEEQIMNIS